MSITDIGQEAAEATSDRNDSDTGAEETDYERVDVSEHSFVKMHPGPTALEGRAQALRYFPPAPDGESEYDDNDRGKAGVILTDVGVPDDDDFESVTVFESNQPKGDDFKVVNVDDEEIDVYDAGVSVREMFESEEVDGIDDDEVVLTLSTSAGRSIARTLDVCGLPNADFIRNEDYEPVIHDHGYPETNNGLIEKNPDNDEDTYEPPRYARDPQLRPDAEGERVVILLQHLANVQEDYDGNSHWATVLIELDDDRMQELAESYAEDDYYEPDDSADFIHDVNGTDMLRLAPTMEFEPDGALVQETEWHEWHWLDDDEIGELREAQDVDVDE